MRAAGTFCHLWWMTAVFTSMPSPTPQLACHSDTLTCPGKLLKSEGGILGPHFLLCDLDLPVMPPSLREFSEALSRLCEQVGFPALQSSMNAQDKTPFKVSSILHP